MSYKRSDIVTYVEIYAILLLFLALTVEAARYDLGRGNFALAILIATTKAIMIALFFMHVRNSKPLIKLVVVACLIWMAILFSLSLADYWTRDWDSLVTGSHNVTQSIIAQ